MARKASSKREHVDTGTDERFVTRHARGQFSDSVDVGRSLAADRRTAARTPGHRNRGDRER